MPGSQRRFAVDFDADGRVDLMNSPQDAIGSVARFLKLHGWTKGQPIAERTKGKIANDQMLINAGIKPSLEYAMLTANGLANSQLPSLAPAALVDLVTPEADTEYWWGLGNFYAITRYNRSSFYAMSVVQLAEAIKIRRADLRPLKPLKTKNIKTNYRAKPRHVG